MSNHTEKSGPTTDIESELNKLLRRKIGRGLLVKDGHVYVDLTRLDSLVSVLKHFNEEDEKEDTPLMLKDFGIPEPID